jgi:preprotein translocase YajC subunit
LLIFVIFLNHAIIRPHRKRQEMKDKMISSARRNSVIYAGGGIRGTVIDIKDGAFLMESGPKRTLLEIDMNFVEGVENSDEIIATPELK